MSFLAQAQDFAEAFFVYAACTEAGFVKVGISRTPFRRISEIHYGSPSPVKAVQWAWVGSAHGGRRIESGIRTRWKDRNTRGEWYRFDYKAEADQREFHDGLNAVFTKVCRVAPEWERLGPVKVKDLLQENWDRNQAKTAEKAKKPWHY